MVILKVKKRTAFIGFLLACSFPIFYTILSLQYFICSYAFITRNISHLPMILALFPYDYTFVSHCYSFKYSHLVVLSRFYDTARGIR